MNVVRGKILSKKQHGGNVGLSNFCFGGRVAGWTLEVSYGGETYTVESMFSLSMMILASKMCWKCT